MTRVLTLSHTESSTVGILVTVQGCCRRLPRCGAFGYGKSYQCGDVATRTQNNGSAEGETSQGDLETSLDTLTR